MQAAAGRQHAVRERADHARVRQALHDHRLQRLPAARAHRGAVVDHLRAPARHAPAAANALPGGGARA